MVTQAPTLVYCKQSFKIFVETDFFKYVNSEVFAQLGEDRLLHPVVFFSKDLNPVECNYEIYDKELLAIISYFEQ